MYLREERVRSHIRPEQCFFFFFFFCGARERTDPLRKGVRMIHQPSAFLKISLNLTRTCLFIIIIICMIGIFVFRVFVIGKKER